jgi:hypothetical protein
MRSSRFRWASRLITVLALALMPLLGGCALVRLPEGWHWHARRLHMRSPVFPGRGGGGYTPPTSCGGFIPLTTNGTTPVH